MRFSFLRRRLARYLHYSIISAFDDCIWELQHSFPSGVSTFVPLYTRLYIRMQRSAHCALPWILEWRSC